MGLGRRVNARLARDVSPAELVFPFLRVMLGVLFLSVWVDNLRKNLYDPGPYAALIDGYADEGSAPEFWKELMRLVADNAALFSKLQLAVELAFGVLLVIGLFTRIVGLLAGGYLTALWISEVGVPNEWIWSLVFPALVAFAVALHPEAARFGVSLPATSHIGSNRV